MYSSIRINGYRGLESFRLEGLGRINLLVGTNNCGKTSILECLELLRSSGMNPILSSLLRRQIEWEYLDDKDDNDRQAFLDVKHLFTGYDLERRVSVEADRINTANSSDWSSRVTISAEDESENGESSLNTAFLFGAERALRIDWPDDDKYLNVPISSDGILKLGSGWRVSLQNDLGMDNQFIGAKGMSKKAVASSLGRIILTKDEEYVVQALEIIEPKIERVAPVPSDQFHSQHSVVLKLKGNNSRILIENMGAGMWRMLGLALAISTAKGGVLLVDEIDTGLHYSVMKDMWQMISQRAGALGVQVFATTHSRDCYESLAAIADPDSSPCSVTIQRIDPNHGQAVRFSNDEIVVAAERGIEVR